MGKCVGPKEVHLCQCAPSPWCVGPTAVALPSRQEAHAGGGPPLFHAIAYLESSRSCRAAANAICVFGMRFAHLQVSANPGCARWGGR